MDIFVKTIIRPLSLVSLATALLVISGCADQQRKSDNYTEPASARKVAVQKYDYRGVKDELFVEALSITPAIVTKGSSITQQYRFAVLAPVANKQFHVQEVVTLSGNDVSIELSRKVFKKSQAIHKSTLTFTIPKDLPNGNYSLITIISTSGLTKKMTGAFSVR
jgi:hypothetical protein